MATNVKGVVMTSSPGSMPSSSMATMQGRGAAVEADAMFRAAEPREILFKLRHVRPEAERAVVKGARDGGVEILADAAQLGRQIEVGDWFGHDGVSVLTAGGKIIEAGML